MTTLRCLIEGRGLKERLQVIGFLLEVSPERQNQRVPRAPLSNYEPNKCSVVSVKLEQ